MILALAVPLLASVVLGVFGPGLSRRSGGWVAVRLVPVTAVLVAGSTLVALAGFAVVVLARIDDVAAAARLSVRALPTSFRDVPVPVGLAVGIVVGALGAAALHRAVRLGRDVVDTQRTCRLLPTRPDGVRLVDDDRPHAFAVVGLHGQVVVSTGMWASLGPGERDAVLAHERAHLRRHHHLSLIAVRLAAAADPLLRPVVAATRFAVEREADEDAGATVAGGRRLVGIAVARAALAVSADRRHRPAAAAELAIDAGDVPRRVAALLAPRVRTRPWACVPLLVLALLALAMTLSNGMATDHHIDRARAAFAVGSAPVGSTPVAPGGSARGTRAG